MTINDPEKIYSIIKEQSGREDSELKEELEKIKAKYNGLLSDVGANIMLAKQLNVNLDLKKKSSSLLEIKDLNSSLSSVSLYSRIRNIPPVKRYKTKDGSTGKLQTIFIVDNTGTSKLNLWQDKVDLVDTLNLKKNDLIFIKDAYVGEYKDKIDLSLRHGGQIIKNPDNAPNIKKIEYNLKKISEIDSAIDEPISIVGRIVSMFPAKEFEDKNQRKRKVLNFNISDGVKQIRCVAWSPWAEVFEDQYNRGDLVQLDDVVVKEGLYDLEVYLNWSSTVIKNPELSYQIPPLKELISNEYKEEKIENLEDRNNYKIKGLIVNIIKNNLRFFKCPNCKERVYLINDEFICESCNEVVDPIVNLVANLEIDDSSGIIRTTIFNNVVEDLFKVKKEELKKDLSDEEKEELFSRIEDELIGKKVVAIGRAKINDFSSNLEFIANTIDFEDNTDSE